MRYLFLPLLTLAALFVLVSVFLPSSKTPCANTYPCTKQLSARIDTDTWGVFEGQRIPVPSIDTSPLIAPVLGTESATDTKHIYVDLEKQTLYAFDGSTLFFKTLVSTGKWNKTPPGEYKIWVKLRSTRMSGGSGADAYDLPNVPYTMFFYNDSVPKESGFSLHGAYWHNNFGHVMSHGCVNMRTIDAKVIYDWATPTTTSNTTYATSEDPGTLVSICSQIQTSEGQNPVCLE